jgi:hypothetical protein
MQAMNSATLCRCGKVVKTKGRTKCSSCAHRKTTLLCPKCGGVPKDRRSKQCGPCRGKKHQNPPCVGCGEVVKTEGVKRCGRCYQKNRGKKIELNAKV